MDTPPVIDFSNTADIAAKLPAADAWLASLDAQLLALTREAESWREYVALLRRRVGAESPGADAQPDVATETIADAGTPSVQQTAADAPTDDVADESGDAVDDRDTSTQPLDLVVEVVNREFRKIRSMDVAEILRSEGHEQMTNGVVSNALFYGANRAKPPRISTGFGRGFYAPLGFEDPASDDQGHGFQRPIGLVDPGGD